MWASWLVHSKQSSKIDCRTLDYTEMTNSTTLKNIGKKSQLQPI